VNSIIVSIPSARRTAIVASLFLLAMGICSADTVLSETGTLSTPEDTVLIKLSLPAGGDVTLQTYSFGGGTNGANAVIPPGGFDPFVGLFEGTGATALFLDGTADDLSNYPSEPSACPPAGLVTIGSVTGQCGDVRLQFNGLAPGTYTVLLSDANYTPLAVYETTGYLGDGFSDLTGGSFPLQTCYDANDCNTDTANWALDITEPSGTVTPTPEPRAVFELAGLGLAFAAMAHRRSTLKEAK
jgi:hypothetical protein